MKILLINDYASVSYGAESQVLDLKNGLMKKGHEVRIFSSDISPVSTKRSFADYECMGAKKPFNTILQTANPFAFWQLRKILAGFKPDVVHVRIFLSQMSPLILPLLNRVPAVYHVVVFRPVCPLGTKVLPRGTVCHDPPGVICYRRKCIPLRSLFFQLLQLRLFHKWRKAFNAVVTTSRSMEAHLISGGIHPDMTIMNPVNLRPLRPPLSSPPIIAYAGRMVREKGVDVLIKAFGIVLREVPEAKLILSGDGSCRETLNMLVSALGLQHAVKMTGYLFKEDMEREFDHAWVQVVPSLWDEPFGNVAAEAMIRGTAVVASNSGGMAQIVRDPITGRLVPPGDVNALADAMLQIIKDRDLAERMGLAGREYALTHLNQESYIEKIIQLYHSILPVHNVA